MLKFNKLTSQLETVGNTNLKNERILERFNLQKSIISSWDAFRNELGLASTFLIGQEITPDDSTQNSLDLLAYDSDDSSLIVIELKRDKNKLQLLQALSYAAMIANRDKDFITGIIRSQKLFEWEELLEIVESNDINQDVKVVLIAEEFHPEVIITSDWLSNYGVSVSAFAMDLHGGDENTFLTIEQRYPLKGLSDVYKSRTRRATSPDKKLVTWEDVIPTCEYPFAKKAIEMCRTVSDGNASRKRFHHIMVNFEGFKAVTLFFRRKYVNVYLIGGDEESLEALCKNLTGDVQTGSWRDGFSLQIYDEQQFIKLISLGNTLSY